MKKRNLIIIISVLLVVLTTLIVIVAKNKKSETTNGKSEELLAAEKIFSEVILDEKKNEYILERLQNNSNTYKAKIEIPDTIDNIPVTMLIDSNDFASFSNVITIKLGKNIKWIGNSIPSDEELATNEFGNSIFVNATSLTEINVSDENTKFSSISGVLFNKEKTILVKFPVAKGPTNDNPLTYKVPTTVEKIADYAFYNSKHLKGIELSENITSIGRYAFSYCEKLDDITYNDKLETIESNAFSNCKVLSLVNLPKNLKKISYGAFRNCKKINLFIPKSVEIFEKDLFTGVEEISIRTTEDNVEDLATIIIKNYRTVADKLAGEYAKYYPSGEYTNAVKTSIIIENE